MPKASWSLGEGLPLLRAIASFWRLGELGCLSLSLARSAAVRQLSELQHSGAAPALQMGTCSICCPT